MPLDWIFLWLLGITAGVRFFYAIRLRSLPDGIYASLMLSVTFLIWVYPSEHQWILAAGIWLIWGFIPGLSSLLIERWVSQQCYAPAILLAKINALLMPFVGHSQQAAYLAALQHAQQGHMEKAQGILKQDTMPNTPMGQVMVCHAWVMLSDWMAIVKRVEAMEDRALGKNPAMLLFYGRALGELGELNRLVSGFSKLERCLTKYPETTKATFKNQYRLFLFSYLGQLSRVEALLSGPLVHYSDALKQFWLAVTESAAGHHETAQQRYQTLLESGTPDIVRRVEQRLVQRTPPQAQGILNIAKH